ncbi:MULTISPECIES: HEPN domain-containing protein [Agrobacterium]|uniref:HEPN domain-containing protein n=1 Tax=Agrobacterium TaxID=357 RepID=UPI000363A346|nr:HEPN domain-containing protein [Agrobacterium sp. 10MFCol1.1]
MKSPTQYYSNLKKSLRAARKITGGINKLGCETELQHLKLQSYILLCHAALEQYIEDLGLAAALSARTTFASEGIITKTLVALISSKLVDEVSVKSKSKLSTELVSNIEEFSKEAFSRYRAVITSNNGIIDKDQGRVFVPVGVDPASVDIVLMNAMHSFGAKRGDVAHKFKVQRTDTLTAVQTDLESIASGIIAYDQAVCDALKVRLR